jgi:hypothetical protein
MKRNLCVVAFAFVAFAQSQPPSPGPTKVGQVKQQDATSKDGNREDHKEIVPISVVVNTPVTQSPTQQEHDSSSAEHVIEVLTFFIALATIAQAIIYALQTGLMKKALAATEKAANAAASNAESVINSERAWITIIDILAQDGRGVLDAGFIFNVMNGGKTAAKISGLAVRCHCCTTDVPEVPDYSKATRHTFDNSAGSETILIPGQKLPTNLRIPIEDTRDQELIEGIFNRTTHLYAYGLLTYRDAFDRERILQFGYQYGPQTQGALGWMLPAQWAPIQKGKYNRYT